MSFHLFSRHSALIYFRFSDSYRFSSLIIWSFASCSSFLRSRCLSLPSCHAFSTLALFSSLAHNTNSSWSFFRLSSASFSCLSLSFHSFSFWAALYLAFSRPSVLKVFGLTSFSHLLLSSSFHCCFSFALYFYSSVKPVFVICFCFLSANSSSSFLSVTSLSFVCFSLCFASFSPYLSTRIGWVFWNSDASKCGRLYWIWTSITSFWRS